MKKIIISLFLSFLYLQAHAEIQVQVDPSQVVLGEEFKLTLTQQDPQNGGVPDLSVLQQDFSIIGTERNVNYSIINGQTQSVSQWIITLKAKKSGILTIPEIKLGVDQSAALTINVQSAAKNQLSQNNTPVLEDLQLVGDANVKNPYVNQQVTYTVTLYNSKRLLDADYQGPQVEDALLIPLGDTKRSQTVKNNTNYIVEEQKYAIFPQKSGSLTVNSATFSALIYDSNPQRIKAQDKPLQLTVQPIPKQFKGKTWLPAKQVKLIEAYENTSQTIEQGSTLTRTVTIEGVGVPAQLLPTLSFSEKDAFSVYPEKGKENNKVIYDELVGSASTKVTYLFNKTGKVIIPEVKLAWFNTETGKEETAILPPRSIEVKPSAAGATQPRQNAESMPNTSSQDMKSANVKTDHWAWAMALMFAIAWIGTMGLWAWQRRQRTLGKGSYKIALNELGSACKEGDPAKARDALLKWASMHWPDAPILNLSDLTKLVRDVHVKKQLQLLTQALYRQEGHASWRGDELLRCVHGMKKSKSVRKSKGSSLPPINRL